MNDIINKETTFINLGLKDYKEALDFQTDLFNKALALKSTNRNLPPEEQQRTENYLLFVEHPHVYTLGKSGDAENLLIKLEDLNTIGATYYHINRGGDITYHGPGQIVGYPILDLENFFTDIHRYMRLLEESIILTLSSFGIVAGRYQGFPGVWIDPDDALRARKICAVGVKMSRWITLHGFALNVNTDLHYFENIVPCGLKGTGVTSMAKELGAPQDMQAVADVLKNNFKYLFDMSLHEQTL